MTTKEILLIPNTLAITKVPGP